MSSEVAKPDYFRRDQGSGVTPPDLSKRATYAEHIVRARGKRTQYTSVSLHPHRITDFGECLYRLERDLVDGNGHLLVEHEALMAQLREVAASQDKADRTRAIQALRYARMRSEGLVDWRFDTDAVSRKDLITWARRRVADYFVRA